MLHLDNCRAGFLEVDQYRALVANLPGYLRAVIATAYITGWRTHSELLTRQWRHIDLIDGWIRERLRPLCDCGFSDASGGCREARCISCERSEQSKYTQSEVLSLKN